MRSALKHMIEEDHPGSVTDMIWIVERVRDEQYGQSKRVISWHKTQDKAEGLAARLQAEFEQACELAWPWHEVIETIFEMREEQELVSQHVWMDCDLEDCGYLENPHQHHAQMEPGEHERALIEQLTDWWHQERLDWQMFVEDEIMTKMTDPPRYCQELVQPNEAVHYECHAVSSDPVTTSSSYTKRAQQKLNSEP